MTMIASFGLTGAGLGLNLPAAFRRQNSLNQLLYSAVFSQCKYCMLRRLNSVDSSPGCRVQKRRSLSSYKSSQNYYEVLGVNRSATSGDIKRAFLSRSKELHPDRNPNTGSHTEFVKLNEAYSTLKSYESRKLYDQQMGFNLHGNWQSSSTNSSYPGSGGSVPYEYYNPDTGKIEWRSTAEPDDSQGGRKSKQEIRRMNLTVIGVLFAVVIAYAALRIVLVAHFHERTIGNTPTFVGVHSRRDHRFRNMDYDRLMHLDAQRSQHSQTTAGKPSNKETTNERTLTAQGKNS